MSLERALQVFDAVCDLDPDAREQALSGESEGVADQVRAMIRADEPGMTEIAWNCVVTEIALPSRVGSFRLGRELGRGATGVVLEGTQDAPRRRVAVKILHPWLDTPLARARFHDEATTLAGLRHPGVPFVIASGTEGRHLWMAQELVDGPSLDAIADSLDRPRRLAVLLELVDVVAAAHARGLVHLDLKPANVRLGAHGPVVLDFGIAQVAGAAGLRSGTPRYMAPEQRAGAPVAAAADVYALARMGEELDLDEPARAVLSPALAKDPSDRPEDAAALAVMLRRAVGVEPPSVVVIERVVHADVSLVNAIVREADPRGEGGGRGSLASALESAAALADRGALASSPKAELGLRLALVRSYFGRDHLEAIQSHCDAAVALIPRVDDPELKARTHLLAGNVARRSGDIDQAELHAEAAQALLPESHPDQGQLWGLRGWIAWGRGHYADAAAWFERAVATSSRAGALAMYVASLARAGGHDQARAGAEELMELRRSTRDPDHPDMASAWSTLAQAAWFAGDLPRATQGFAEELRIHRLTLGDGSRAGSAAKWLARCHLAAGRVQDAVELAEYAVRSQEGDPFVAPSLGVLAEALAAAGRPDDALRRAEQAFDVYLERVGPDNPDTWKAAVRVGSLAHELGRPDAVSWLERAHESLLARLGEDHPRVVDAARTLEDVRAARHTQEA